ncbi:hypothetical protein ACWF94_24930 [Streptomyces sp. NPDC055078]
MTDSPARTYAERLAAASPLAAAALALGDLAKPSDRNAEIAQLGQKAGLLLVYGGDDFDPHFARPDETNTRCGQEVARWLNEEQTARISVLCTACEKAATERLVTEMLKAANEADARVRTNPDPTDREWRAALEDLTVALNFVRKHDPVMAKVIDSAAQETADDAAPAEPTKGVAPRHAAQPDTVAALAVLAGLKAAELTDVHDLTEPSDTDLPVRGYAVEPRGHGLVAAYWLEGGLARRRDDGWHGPALDALADRFKDAGWAVEPLRASSLCVFAHRPQPDPAHA